jgi:hypothetical protein
VNDPAAPDPETVAAVTAAIDQAAAIAVDANDVPQNVELPEGPSDLGSVTEAFKYTGGLPGRRADGSGRYFGPMAAFGDGLEIPPSFDNLPEEARALWEAVADQVTSPIAQARLNDICFEARWGHGGNHARRAIEGYLRVAGSDGVASDDPKHVRRDLGAMKALARALDLARRTRQDDLADATLKATAALASKAIDREAPGAGYLLGLIETLVVGGETPDIVDPLLARARAVYADDPFQTVSTIELQLQTTGHDEVERTQLRRQIVETWFGLALKSAGAVRMAHLQTAVTAARNFGFRDLVDSITSEMQAIDVENLGLVRRSYSISIPEEALEEYLAQFTEAPGWQDAIVALCVYPPSGDLIANREAAAEAARTAPLQAVLPHVRIGGDGLPRFTASTNAQKEEWQLAEQEMLRLNVQGGIIAETLDRIWKKWGPLSQDDLATFLQGPHVGASLAHALARDLLRYFSGDAEGAAYSGAPRVEALVRSLVLAMGLPVYRTQRAQTPGQYPGLGALLPALLAAGMDESWCRFLSSFLTSPVGANVRNEILHGFVDEVSRSVAALILIGALYLAKGVGLVEASSPTEAADPAPQPDDASPVGDDG